MRKRVLSALMAVCLMLTLLPVSAFAADESGMVFNKRYDEESGTLTLEAWATGKEVTIPGTSTPLDIVLVLDQSGSMEDDFGRGTRQEAMKEAVTNFVDQVADNARDNRVEHQIGIVTFGDDAETLVKLQDAEENRDSIKWSVKWLPERPEGATRVDQGMDEAADMLAGARKDSKKVVIVFTDGVPTTSNAFSVSVANSALKTALEMKQDDTTIYTVGIFEGADPDELYGKDHALWGSCDGNVGSYWSAGSALFWGDVEQADVPAGNRFLNYLSSKYEASEIGLDRGGFDILLVAYTSYEITRNFNPVSDEDYYLTAADADGLTDAFEKIEDSIGSQPVNAALDERTQIVDEISPYFEISEDADAVKVYTVNYTGSGWAAEKGEAEGVDVTVEDGTVTVSGYDFAANYVSSTPHDGGYGQKLVIEITVAPVENPDACGTAQIPTNGDAEVVLGGTPIETAETPTVTGVELDYANNDELVGGVSNLPEGGYYVSGVNATVSGEVPVTTTENVVFAGWSTGIPDELLDENDKDIASGLLNGGDIIAMDGEKTLYAVWAKDSDGDGTPDYDEEEELTPDGSSVKVSKVPVTASTLLLTTLNNEKVSLTSGKDYIQATGNATDGYQVYTTGDSATVMWSVTIDSTKPGFITVSDDGATYKGATFGNRAGAKVEANASGDGYVVTFDEMTSSEDAGLAVLYFSREITGLTDGESQTVKNVAVVGGGEVPSGDVTIVQGQTYSVKYEWKQNYNAPNGETPPTDRNQYAEGTPVVVDREGKYWVGKTITKNNNKHIFYGWEVTKPTGITIGADNTFTMPASDVTITGTWQVERGVGEDTNYITVQVVNGTAECETAGFNITDSISHFEAAEGQDYTITFTPDKGYMLDTVIVDGGTAELTNGSYTFENIDADHGIVVYFVEDPNYEETPELTPDDLSTCLKEPVTDPSVTLSDGSKLTAGTDYIAAVKQANDSYMASTTGTTATVLYRVKLIPARDAAGSITVSDEGALYKGAATSKSDAAVTDNSDGTYTVTFTGSGGSRYAYLYFAVTVDEDDFVNGQATAANTAIVGGKEEPGDNVTVIQGETYRVTYVWGDYHPDMEGYRNPPVDPTLYREGDVVTVDDTYYVGESVFFNDGRRYIFLGWEVQSPADGVTIDENNQFEMPAEDVILVGNWQFINKDNKDRPYITVKVVNGSAVFDEQAAYKVEDGVKTFQVTTGNDYTITFTPAPGYTLGTVMVDGKWVPEGLDDGNTYTFENIDADHGIVVYFVKDTNEYTLTYDENANDPTIDGVPAEVTGKHYGETVTVAGGPTRDEFVFVAWNTQANGEGTTYNPDDSITITGNTTLYAIWAAEESSASVDKTVEITRDGEVVTGEAQPGDVLTYTITLTNTGNVAASFEVTDTFTGGIEIPPSEPTPTGGTSAAWDNKEAEGIWKYTWFTGVLDPQAEWTATYTYTVQDTDAGNTITNSVVVNGAVPSGDPETETEVASYYTLTYDGNGKDVTNVPEPETDLAAGLHDLSTTVPTYGDYVFMGWTEDKTAEGTIYEAGQQLPETTKTVNMEKDTTVYAVWGEDTNGDEVADAKQVLITPAKITIYEGGEGYDYALGDADQDIDGQQSSGLPEPGYYIVLPWQVNEDLKDINGVVVNEKGYVNLAEHLTFSYNDENDSRVWHLTTYDPDGQTHLGDGRYIYRILPATVDGKEIPVRLVFTDESGKETLSDDFTFSANDLYAKFQMTIYDGGLEQSKIQAKVDGTTKAQDVGVGTGELVIRGTTDTAATVAVNDMEHDADGFTVTADAGNVYYVNGSPIQVQESDIRLLADDLAMEEDSETEKAMQDAADKAIDTALDNPQYEFKYLDLVDYNNGNAYVTLNQNSEGDYVTVNWSMPANADPDTIHVVHFEGMDREFDIAQLNDYLDKVDEIESVDVNGDVVSFSTSNFSPFVLVYETKATEYYTVRFDSNGGSSVASQRVADGQTAREPSDPTRSNYRFEGWYLNGKLYDFDTPVTADITLEAHWDRIDDDRPTPDYAILRFESNGGTEFDDIERDEPFNYNPYDNIPTRSGYRFTGWYRDSSLRNRLDDEDLRVTWGITTVYAGWAETSVPSMLNGSDHYAYIQGYSDGSVRPEANITRAQVATIFFRLLDEDVRDDNLTTYNTFPDVNEDYWANTAISTMASLGVINGRNNGNFDPNAYITRAEFAAICARFDDSDVTGVSTFTDIASHWAKDEIERAAALGWVQGYADGTFRPNAYITRAQAVTMINRVLNRLPEDADDLLSGMNVWTDCQEGDWYYLAIQEATNSHDFETKNRVYETWTDLNSDPDWSRYEN